MFEKSIAGSGHAYEPRLDIDYEVEFNQLTDALLTELGMLEPYGIGNPEPILAARAVEVISQRMFKDKHLGLRLRQGNVSLDGIWFNSGEISTLPGKIDIAFTPEFNKWNGRKDVRLRILDGSW
jgi:single-stranded-DNA-specific exonuclease